MCVCVLWGQRISRTRHRRCPPRLQRKTYVCHSMTLLSVVVTHMLYNTYKRTSCSSYVCMCMGAYILWCVRHMAPFSHNSPNSFTPSGEYWRVRCHSADRVSPGNPHKCTVGKTVLSRDHPDVIRPPQMTRQAQWKARAPSGGEHVLGWAVNALSTYERTRSACLCVHNVYCI